MKTKERILKTALELFSKKGYEVTSMKEIAKRVGIKKASLYSHFSAKSEIFERIFEKIINDYKDFTKKICNSDATLSIKKRLKKIFREYVFYNKRNAGMNFWDRVYYFPPVEFKEYIYDKTLETGKEFSNKLKDIFVEGIEKKEIQRHNPDSLVATYLYALNGLALSVGLYNEDKLDAEIEKAIGIFLEII